jgi:glycosyltransferase involved in cell wall biosynthesis
MRLLIITQKMDKNDPILGFFHRWVADFSKQFESIVVICLEKGACDLPPNVRVLSLGKEEGKSRLKYISRFYSYIWSERKNYDAVFVHMNQEYVLLGGIFWKIFSKHVYMWRNHHSGSFLTDIAASFCKKVFCTSKYSYTAKYKKTLFMPVGIDTNIFKQNVLIERIPRSVLFLGRIAPVKKPDFLIRILADMARKKGLFSATIVGDPLSKDIKYYESLKKLVQEKGLKNKIAFEAGVPNNQTPAIYSAHEIFINLSSSGMYDKTIFEAMACESLALASNKNLHGLVDDRFIFEEGNAKEFEAKLGYLLSLESSQKRSFGKEFRRITIENHSLESLALKLKENIV